MGAGSVAPVGGGPTSEERSHENTTKSHPLRAMAGRHLRRWPDRLLAALRGFIDIIQGDGRGIMAEPSPRVNAEAPFGMPGFERGQTV